MASSPRQRPHVMRAIVGVLVVKFLALDIIWNVWFSAPEARRLNRERIATAIYSAPAAAQESREAHARP